MTSSISTTTARVFEFRGGEGELWWWFFGVSQAAWVREEHHRHRHFFRQRQPPESLSLLEDPLHMDLELVSSLQCYHLRDFGFAKWKTNNDPVHTLILDTLGSWEQEQK
nr:hypothetical protein CFP56_29709 [Quercus suber]